jgi:hypothetical protein
MSSWRGSQSRRNNDGARAQCSRTRRAARKRAGALLYISQYAPALGAAIIDKVGPKRVAAARDGSSMYTQR